MYAPPSLCACVFLRVCVRASECLGARVCAHLRVCVCVCVCVCLFVLSAYHPSVYPATSARPSQSPWLLQHHAPVLSDVHAGLPDRQHRHGRVKLKLQLAVLAACGVWEREGRSTRDHTRTDPHVTQHQQLLQKYTCRDKALPCTGVVLWLTSEFNDAT